MMSHSSPLRLACKALASVFVLLILCLTIQAQFWTQYDQGTPPQHATGVSSLGSYVSTEIGTVNLSNGALNIHLPLATVGGRGFSIPISLNYSSKVWSVTKDNTPGLITGEVLAAYASYGGNGSLLGIYNGMDLAGWSTGGVPIMKRQFVGVGACESGNGYQYVLTKLSAMMPDGGEIELRDDSYDGAARLIQPCSLHNDVPRSLRWHATDGSGTIFIYDNSNNLAGTLITGDGMRYRFDSIFTPATNVTDRNGNQISINRSVDPNNSAHVSVEYIDQLGRSTKVEQGVPDPANGAVTLALLVTVKGYQATTHYYKVKKDTIGNLIRSDLNYNHLPIYVGEANNFGHCYTETGGQPPPANYIFPDSYCLPQQQIDNQSQVSEVDLPDGRSLQFKYNLYGEVAEVTLPTGARLQYDYGLGGFPSGNTLDIESNAQINGVAYTDRAVTERRTYPDDTTLEASWTYTFGSKTVNGGSRAGGTYACTEVKAFQGPSNGGTLLFSQRHFFEQAQRYLYQEEYSVTGTGYSKWSTSVEWRTETLDSSGNAIITATEQDWSQRTAVSWPAPPGTPCCSEQISNDNRVNETRHYLDNGSFAKTDTYYQANTNWHHVNNPIEVDEYDFDQSLKRHTLTSYVDNNSWLNGFDYTSDAIHLLSLPLTQTVYDGNSNQVAQTINEYDNYGSDNNHPPFQDYGDVIGHDSSYGPGKTARGSLTAVGRWLNTSGTTIYSYLGYDTLGNAVSHKDANGNLTTLSYTDDFGDGGNPGGGGIGANGATYAFPTLLTSPPPQSGQPQQTARSQYDISTGLLTGFKDRNGIVTQTLYCRLDPDNPSVCVNDPFDRPGVIKTALGISGVEARTAIYYAQKNPTTAYGVTLTNNDVLTVKDQTSLGDATLRSWTHTDGFGRTTESWSRDPQGDDKVSTIYDALSRVKQGSNPFRPSQGESAVYTTTSYDLAGRITSVTTPDNAVVNTYYNANQVLVKDQAGKERMSQTNALGQLIDVWEITSADQWTEGVSFPGHGEVATGYHTSYVYDALDNLRTLTQGTQPARTFNYDSLKRLTSASNPESGTVSYQYDGNGNLAVKTDARLASAHYSYDALNRVTRRWYNGSNSISATSNNSPALPSGVGATDEVNYTYDTASNGKGRLASVSSNVSTYSYSSYDAMGRALGGTQIIGSQSYSISNIVYDRAGHLTSMTYPSGRTITETYDNAGRLQSFSGYLGDGNQRTYSTGIAYSPFGGMTREQFGTQTAIFNQLGYNSRGQLAEILAGSGTSGNASWNRGKIINWYSLTCGGATCNATENNGNLRMQEMRIPNDEQNTSSTYWNQGYEYDSLNRLTHAWESSGWHRGYSYDRYGNRTINPNLTWGDGPSPVQFGVDTNTNRLTLPGGSSGTMSYDNAGNLTTDTYSTAAVLRAYDAENRMKSETTWNNVVSGSYSYDGDGRRVKRVVGSTETWQVYGIGGELLAEYAVNGNPSSPQKEYGYRNGQLLVTATASSGGWGPAPGFDDNPLNPHYSGETPIRSVHITQLRAAINSLRSHFNLGPYSWQTAAQPGDLIKADPIAEMRIALDQALGPPSPPYTPGLAQGQPILAAHIQELRTRVLNAWQSGGGGVDIRWLVSDQLGTPRMIFDSTGNLSGVSRHDYLPFGEELGAGTGGRTAAQGYSANDGVRQQFSQKERDNETGLDYFLARYYSSTQGRFTSPDEFKGGPEELYTFADDASNNPTFYADLKNPQSLNKYQYSYNNPLRYTDPDGHDPDADPDLQDPACGCKKNPAQEAEAAKENLQKLADAVAGATGITALAEAIRQSAKDSAAQIGTTIVITTAVVTTLVTPKPVDPNAIPAVPAPPPPPIAQAKGRDKAQPTTPPLTGPEKAKADRERKRSDPRTKAERKADRQKRARDRTGPNDPHDDEGPHHRRPDPKTIRPGRKFEE